MATKKKASPVKKAPAKAPAKKSAPAKAPAKKSAPAKAPAKKTVPAKAPAKKTVPAKAPAGKNTAPAKVATPKKGASGKAPAKTPASVAKKPEPAKKPTSAKGAVKDASKGGKKDNAEKVVQVKKPKIDKAPATEPAPVDVDVDSTDESTEVKGGKQGKGSKTKIELPFAVLLEGGKRLSKTIMFYEIDEHEDGANKKKVSSELKNLEKKPTMAVRRKASLAEETQEELTERILKELEEQNLAFTREAATQICTRCNKNLVSPEFWVDKHLGYCEECAAILKLGQSKEARKVDYQMGLLGQDSLDEEDEDNEFMDGPDAADLKEAEEELAELDD